MKSSFAALTLILFLGIISIPEARAWWDGKWKHRVSVQFNTSSSGADIRENVTEVPVLVRLHGGNFPFSDANADGSDLRFVDADDKSPLKYHIEKFDPLDEIALIWVKVPRMRGASDRESIWLYYGNASAADGQDSGGTYDVNQTAVFHLGELSGSPRDATAYGNHATVFTGKLGVPSIIGTGVQFNGAAFMRIPRSSSLDFAKGFALSVWIRPSQQTGTSCVFSWDDGAQSITIGLADSRPYASVNTGAGRTAMAKSTDGLTPNKWYHIAVTVDPETQVSLYVDGSEVATTPLRGAMPSPSSDIFIGAAAGGADGFIGDMDEIQLSNIVRPAAWMKAAFHNQGPDGKLISVTETESGGGGESLTIQLLKVVVRTITLDSWIILGILFFMGSAAVYIFGRKVALIREAKKGNEMFSQSFRRSEHLFSLIEKNEEFNSAPLYRVYRAGCEELALMLERRSDAFRHGKKLPVAILNGLRSALEKSAVHESRKLSAGLVILNVSISGGPFLGLLGTVWGVMNTFASLAESGEASLTAIAPGVASALACTLGGLLVAIPALFGSSYVTSQIKDVNADVNLFLDDFIRRLEEEQGAAT